MSDLHSSFRPRAALRLEPLEDRCVPAGLFVAGVGGFTQATDPEVSLYVGTGPRQAQQLGIQLEAFGGTAGDVRVALGDVNGDGTDEVIAAGGFGGPGKVVVFDGASALRGVQLELARFVPYASFAGGVFVAAGDLDRDGFAEIITTPGLGGRGHLKVFSFAGGDFHSDPITSAYTFTDYDGEVRVATMRVAGETLVVTASGAGVPGDVRLFRNAYLIGTLLDGIPVPSQFLAARLVPFGGYSGGLSVAAGDTNPSPNGTLADELFLAKNDGSPTVEVYDGNDVLAAFEVGIAAPLDAQVTDVFPGFLGPIRLGAADVNGDGNVEVLATTGFSGDPRGTPVKAFTRSGDTFSGLAGTSFYANPGYQMGAWLAGKDFTFARDLSSTVTSNNAGAVGSLPRAFSSAAGGEAFVGFGTDLGEAVTGANLSFHGLEVTFGFAHQNSDEVKVDLIAIGPDGAMVTYPLFDGTQTFPVELFDGASLTITANTSKVIPAGVDGAVLTGRFLATGEQLGVSFELVGRALGQLGPKAQLLLRFSTLLGSGNVLAAPVPRIRLLY